MNLRRATHRISVLGLLAASSVVPMATSADAAPVETIVATCSPDLPIDHPGCGRSYPAAPSSTGFQEVRGADRYATAVAAARTGFPDADVAVLVSGEDNHIVDALSAAPLARSLAAPILLTAGSALPQATADYLQQQRPAAVLVIGGEPSVSAAVLERVRSLGVDSVERVYGADRYATSAAIADLMPAGTHAWIASGDNRHLVDALAASGPAARLGEPLVLAPATGDATGTAARLRAAGVTSTTVVGGQSAVAATVADQFPAPTRVNGDSRWNTAKSIADTAAGRGVPRTDVLVTSGNDRNLVDALAAAPLGRITLLTGSGGEGTDIVRNWLAAGQDRATFVGSAAGALVCWEVGDCTRVSSTDVTGDGTPDDVALVGRAGDEAMQVRLRSNGAVQTTTIDTYASSWSPVWIGAHPIDDRAGNELAFLSDVGAHTEWNTVLTWRDGRLAVVDSPDGNDGWVVDTSLALNQSITCETPGRVVFRWTDWADMTGDGLVGYTQAYRSTNGVWAEDGGTSVVDLPLGGTAEYAGWYCGNFPRWGTGD